MANPRAPSLITLASRPDLVPVVAQWLWDEFWRSSGKPYSQLLAALDDSLSGYPIPATFVLMVDEDPVGTASLVPHDLEERPDLTPWLAGMIVVPLARGQGYARHLIDAVERAARRESITTLWLYTRSAERLYARAGWQTVETIEHDGKPYALMKRDLLRHP